MIVLVDVDSTVADLMPEWLRLYNNDYSDNVTPDMITDWDMTKFVHPDCGAKIFSYLLREDLYDNVKPIVGAIEGLEYIESIGNRIVFVSSGMYGYPKFQWADRNGFHVGQWGKNYVVCHDKSLIRGDVLIDDGIHNAKAFGLWRTIIFEQPWNKDFRCPIRATSWDGICKLFEEIS